MKFRLISKSGDGIGLAHRLSLEGHDVDFYLKDEKGKNLYSGILPRVDDWESNLDADTILVFDMVGFGKDADRMAAKGYKVVGSSKIGDDLELDRMFGISVAGNAGIAIPLSENFQSFDDGINFIKAIGDSAGWVFKPENNKAGVRTFVSQSSEQMILMLEHAKEVWTGKVDYVLQEVIEGVEISSEVWCIDGIIVPGSYNNTLEQKRLMAGNYGPNTGCMGSTVQFNLSPKLYEETFAKLEPWLKSVKYNGPLDINCIVDYSGTPYMLEWTARFGYSAIYAMLEVLNMPLGEFLHKIASREMPILSPLDSWGASVRLSMPPYPHCEDAPECEGLPIIGLDMESQSVYPLDVMKKGENILCSGYDAIIAEVSHCGNDAMEVWDELLDKASEIQIPECQCRYDAGHDVLERLKELIELGYIDYAYDGMEQDNE